jgi:hypothetical protein
MRARSSACAARRRAQIFQRTLYWDPDARIDIYYSNDGRVVVVATGDVGGFRPAVGAPAVELCGGRNLSPSMWS